VLFSKTLLICETKIVYRVERDTWQVEKRRIFKDFWLESPNKSYNSQDLDVNKGVILNFFNCILQITIYSYGYWTVHQLTSSINWTNLMSLYESFYCSICFECYYIHPQEPANLCRCIVLFRCVLVYWCCSAGVGWYPNAGWCTSAPTGSSVKYNIITLTSWQLVRVIMSYFTELLVPVAAVSVFYTPDDGRMTPETCRESLQ